LFNEIIIPSVHTAELIPVLGRMLSEGATRDGGDPLVSPSPNGFLGISDNGLSSSYLVSDEESNGLWYLLNT